MKTSHPAPGTQISSHYGPRGSGFHAGTDYYGPRGTAILAFADGVVEEVRQGCTEGIMTCNGGAGNYVRIDHGNGLDSRYLHLQTIEVKQGQRVRVGQRIGTLGNTGHSTGPHLHFEIRQDDTGYGQAGSKNPVPYVEGQAEWPGSKKKAFGFCSLSWPEWRPGFGYTGQNGLKS